MTQHVTGYDVTTAISAQHARIAGLFEHVDNCPVEEKPAALHALTAFLAGHEAVEEELVHPLLPRVGDHDQGLERAREEAGISFVTSRACRASARGARPKAGAARSSGICVFAF